MTRKIVIFFAIALFIAVLAFFAVREDSIIAATARVERGTLTASFSEEGRTRLKARYLIVAPVAGNLRRIRLQPGDPIRAGQTLAEIEPAAATPLDARRREQGEAELRGAEAALNAARQHTQAALAAEKLSRKEHQRLQPLVKAKAASREQLDKARAALETANAGLAAAQAEEQVAEARVRAARALLNDKHTSNLSALAVKAPVSGILFKRHLESATPVSPGQILMEIGDPAQLEIEADVLSDDAVRLHPGTPAHISHWGGETLDAAVTRIEPGGFTKTSALGVAEQRTRVILDIQSPRERWQALGDAYRVDIEFITARKEEVPNIPASALFRHKDGWAVYRLVDGRATLTPVQTGLHTATSVEIVSGLGEGDSVILQHDETIHDGSRIDAHEQNE